MTTYQVLIACFAGWTILACVGGSAWTFASIRVKRAAARLDETQWTPFLPPVPPARRELAGDELDRRFYDVVSSVHQCRPLYVGGVFRCTKDEHWWQPIASDIEAAS